MKDEKKAFIWYEKAALQGYAKAQSVLGHFYFTGLGGLSVDFKKAFEWYEKAALQGNTVAMFKIAEMYFSGKGVPEDMVMAYAYNNLAAANGEMAAIELREKMADIMSPAQIEKAQDISRELYNKIEKNTKK